MEVGDEGPGMPDSILNYVNTHDDPDAPLDERAGLGLWMVKRLSRESGGELTAWRKASGGTTVRLIVPESCPAPDAQEPPEEQRHVA
jgi:signal transduction histidine kinase